MKKVQLFQPLGESLGCCGGSEECSLTDNSIINTEANVKELNRVEAFFNALKNEEGYFVTIHDPASNGFMFTHTEVVMRKLKAYGEEILPIILIDDQVVSVAEFPSNQALADMVGLTHTQAVEYMC